jgi:hypothetical protein
LLPSNSIATIAPSKMISASSAVKESLMATRNSAKHAAVVLLYGLCAWQDNKFPFIIGFKNSILLIESVS